MWIAFEIFINLIQAFIMIMFVNIRMRAQKSHSVLAIVCIAIITLFFSSYLFIDHGISDLVVFVCPLIYSFMISKSKWYVPVFWIVILIIIFTIIVSLNFHLFMGIFDVPYTSLLQNSVERIWFLLVTNGILFLSLYTIAKIQCDYTAGMETELFLFLGIITTLLMVEEGVYHLQITTINEEHMLQLPFLWIYSSILFCVLFAVFAFYTLSRSIHQENVQRQIKQITHVTASIFMDL